jgi:hypothetical protein
LTSFLLEPFGEDMFSLRSSFGEEYEEDEIVEEVRRDGSRSTEEKSEKLDVTVRKDFPESWIFDGDLQLGYRNIF